MYQSILVPVDGSDQSRAALEVATRLVAADAQSLYVLNTQEAPLAEDGIGKVAGAPALNAEELVQQKGREVIEQVYQQVGIDSQQAQPIVRAGKPAQTILAEAKRLGVDAVVMGSRGNSNIKSLVVGSVSHRVMHVAPCAVIVVG
ncbi:universal stress protein [Halomonas piscis]|uniref:Universal stress protein n=1 Tax=Halomonas piscis TaxID=3031727 RepID=A0ABY9Z0I5_9GAMM|nr:universal stress protein [Halomonas piscis]WNK19753.1 universal stress protein [Halomonas piscis]